MLTSVSIGYVELDSVDLVNKALAVSPMIGQRDIHLTYLAFWDGRHGYSY